ncbi:MAG: hypothetical protein DCF25_16035 [Leptolyngbya foveolarum]|uniref:Uncharacterized protein n=1 Tax=Leptolyngbya foveolarum TaxID=47253 RepID=A0A2W4U0F4_9CYAN|nr:MAG: hypothetical protein DCF25_16035 [Leptolyngbya foveolarum]
MPLNAKQLELPYFIPTSENVSQILTELRTSEASNNQPVQDKDFYLFRDRTARLPWRWKGARQHVGKRSAKTFSTQEKAIADAEKQLGP